MTILHGFISLQRPVKVCMHLIIERPNWCVSLAGSINHIMSPCQRAHHVQIVGGALLHLQRKPRALPCAQTFGKLSLLCTGAVTPAAVALERSSSSSSSSAAYGSDPVFNPRSALFDVDAASYPGDFYNISTASGELHPTGVPYGFFARPVPGQRANTYPVAIPVRVTNVVVHALQSMPLALRACAESVNLAHVSRGMTGGRV